ncbi:MAG: hypothetical protein ABMA13_04460 [Chthoniobacteraceae bacterium]
MLRSAFLLGLATTAALAIDIHVSPGGPIASLAAARDAVRKARLASPGEARVIVAAGTYALTEAVVFEPQDSGVSYEAAPGARPIFTGGRKITGWNAESGVWKVKVDPSWRFDALWINGRRATRARSPDSGFIQATGQPLQPLPGVEPTGEPALTLLQVEPEATQALEALSPAELREVNVIVHFSWDVQRYRLATVRAADGTLQFTAGSHRAFFSLEPYHNVVIENFRAALNAPGEWFLALDGTLSYFPRPGEKLETIDAWAPVAT